MTKIKNRDGQNGIRRVREPEDEVTGRTGVPTNQSVSLGLPLYNKIGQLSFLSFTCVKDRHMRGGPVYKSCRGAVITGSPYVVCSEVLTRSGLIHRVRPPENID
jgi:hypothetical protein